jgi:hypothetical protein
MNQLHFYDLFDKDWMFQRSKSNKVPRRSSQLTARAAFAFRIIASASGSRPTSERNAA